jgi:hypothetical protein
MGVSLRYNKILTYPHGSHEAKDLRDFSQCGRGQKVVPGKGIEPLAFGVQNRCSTADVETKSLLR